MVSFVAVGSLVAVVPFMVSGIGVPPQTDLAAPQGLGVLFPHELQGSGFRITGRGAASYGFQVLQAADYFVLADGASWPAGMRLTLTDGSGAAVAARPQPDGVSLQVFLQPGAYVLRVSGLGAADPFALRVVLGRSGEAPPSKRRTANIRYGPTCRSWVTGRGAALHPASPRSDVRTGRGAWSRKPVWSRSGLCWSAGWWLGWASRPAPRAPDGCDNMNFLKACPTR